MRLLGLMPIVLLTGALILTFLNLMAGHSKSFMQDYEILNINITGLGKDAFQAAPGGQSQLSAAIANLPYQVQPLVNQYANTAIGVLGLPQFYKAHVTDFCGGIYVATSDWKRPKLNVTRCSKPEPGYAFDPLNQMQKTLDAQGLGNFTLADMGWWPEDLQKGLKAVKPVTTAVFSLYVLLLIILFVCLFSAVVDLFVEGRLVPCCNLALNVVAMITSIIISALLTGLVKVGTKLINEKGKDYGIGASGGHGFLVITWFASVLLILNAAAWIFFCILPRRKPGSVPAKYLG